MGGANCLNAGAATGLNTSFSWANLGAEGDGCYETAGSVYDVGNIATHEFGHAYGLDHHSAAALRDGGRCAVRLLTHESGWTTVTIDSPTCERERAMKARLVAVLAVTLAAGTGVGTAQAARPTAKLIHVHELKADRARPGGGANCTNDGADSGRYALTGWAVQGNKTALFRSSTLPASLNMSATLSALQSGFSVYSPPAPSINVATSATSSLKPTANHQYELMFGKTGGQTLAVTYTWRWSTGEIESDTLFNTSFSWANLGAEGDGCYETAGSVYDVGNIATHEFGHTYGLDHPSSARFETMYAYGYSGETLKRSLASGDVAGVNAIY